MRGRGTRSGPASLLAVLLLFPLLGGCGSAVGPGAVPRLPSPAGTVGLPSSPRQGFQPDPTGLLARITLHDRYDSAMLSLSTDGRVVLVADTSVGATRDDFVTWTVSGPALDRALGSLRRLGVLEADPGDFGPEEVTPYGRSVGIFFGEGRVIGGSEGSPRFARLWRTVVRLAHPASYGDGLVAGPEPFVPRAIGLLLRHPDPANPYPVARWPFDELITQMAHPVAGSPGELAVCLLSTDATKLFAALPEGRVGVFRWSDGTSVWSGGVDVSTPGYTVHGGGCDPA